MIESELFGHVKGSFTGATADRRGKFELADGGTLFLDEIGDMSLKTQAKVLRALQEQVVEPVGGTAGVRVDVRVLAATNKDLTAEIRAARFREDLYFRLNVIPIFVPPLRDRPGDIPLLAEHFMTELAHEYGRRPKRFDAGAATGLQSYRWPGNVRELRNVIERLMIMVPGETVTASDLSFFEGGLMSPELAAGTPMSLHDARELFERDYILRALAAQQGTFRGRPKRWAWSAATCTGRCGPSASLPGAGPRATTTSLSAERRGQSPRSLVLENLRGAEPFELQVVLGRRHQRR